MNDKPRQTVKNTIDCKLSTFAEIQLTGISNGSYHFSVYLKAEEARKLLTQLLEALEVIEA